MKLFREKIKIPYLNNSNYVITKETSEKLYVESSQWNIKSVYTVFDLLTDYLKKRVFFEKISSYVQEESESYTCFVTKLEIGEIEIEVEFLWKDGKIDMYSRVKNNIELTKKEEEELEKMFFYKETFLKEESVYRLRLLSVPFILKN